MSSSGINTLTTGTINGLNSLALDELTTTTMNAETIDGGIIYYNRIEGNEIIVNKGKNGYYLIHLLLILIQNL